MHLNLNHYNKLETNVTFSDLQQATRFLREIFVIFTLERSNSDKSGQCLPVNKQQNTLQPLYNTVCYNTVLDITQFKDESQKCIDYIEK